MSAPVALPESMLVADCGAVATKVGLIDRVGSEYRLVGVARALTTTEAPVFDISAGVRRALTQLESITGRLLITDAGDLIHPERSSGDGVDAFVATTSAALPIRAAIIGLSRDFSVACAQRALASTYALVESIIAVDEESGRWGTTAREGRAGGPSAAVEHLAAYRPELIVMVGGFDGGAITPLLEMANIVASIGAAMDETARPLVLYAGNREARAQVAERIGSQMEFRSVDNVLPEQRRENVGPLQQELDSIFGERQLRQVPGLGKLAEWASAPIAPTIKSLEQVAQFLARRYDFRVQALDLGASTLALVTADDKSVHRILLPGIGLGYGLDRLVDKVGMEGIGRWLPPSLSLDQAHASLLNQALRPWTIPLQPDERTVLNAAAREALRVGLTSQPNGAHGHGVDLVVLSGAPFARGGKPQAAMLLALDVLDARGVFSVAADLTGIVPSLGAVAAIHPEAAAQVLERDGLATLGTALVADFQGKPRDGTALQVSLSSARGGRLQVSVPSGSLELIPLGVGEKSTVEVRPARGVGVGMEVKNGAATREMEGGLVGLIIDARGRPLSQGGTPEQQRTRSQTWLSEAGA